MSIKLGVVITLLNLMTLIFAYHFLYLIGPFVHIGVFQDDFLFSFPL